ncbi:hypothetical protein T265_03919 [Opisthorchis viverrini]|uniref:WH1 domain-containing protein n=1 Tax=Opisthorchis viverrini TaxID=6198 RepID=A0A074ZPV4_OPIVI|nr:hypothetical protein T265_03919 [Opisthorchis viverrini]KER29453.1 hypothetical protein T265_03919 [Opisthorchis viverrini]
MGGEPVMIVDDTNKTNSRVTYVGIRKDSKAKYRLDQYGAPENVKIRPSDDLRTHPGELPVFTCQAHVFTINPKTKKSWIPSSTKAVDVNFFYDSNKNCYRIISVEDGPGGKKLACGEVLVWGIKILKK